MDVNWALCEKLYMCRLEHFHYSRRYSWNGSNILNNINALLMSKYGLLDGALRALSDKVCARNRKSPQIRAAIVVRVAREWRRNYLVFPSHGESKIRAQIASHASGAVYLFIYSSVLAASTGREEVMVFGFSGRFWVIDRISLAILWVFVNKNSCKFDVHLGSLAGESPQSTSQLITHVF